MNRRRKIVFAGVLLGGCSVLAYSAYVVHVTSGLYAFIKGDHRGWSGTVHKADPVLGYVPVPGSRGAHVVPKGPDIPMRFDDRGFRIPIAGEPARTDARPLVLALGCSFTYGDCCRAEDTFAHIVQGKLGGRVLNAGVCGYGLAGMVLRARRLIPEFRPDVVLVQYAPWLVSRSQQPIGNTSYGCKPVPYYAPTGAGRLAIQPPAFQTKIFASPIRQYRTTDSGTLDYLGFLVDVGIPLTVHDSLLMSAYRLRMATGLIPPPAADRHAVVQSAYTELAEITHAHGARMYVLLLGERTSAHDAEVEVIRRMTDVGVIDGEAALRSALDDPSDEAYRRAYAHWRGDPPTCVDIHPNPRAHSIIAERIVERLGAVDSRMAQGQDRMRVRTSNPVLRSGDHTHSATRNPVLNPSDQ